MADNSGRGGRGDFEAGLGGIFKGLSDLVERLNDLAQSGERLSQSGEFKTSVGGKNLSGVFGVSIRSGIGGDGVRVEPFGNVRRDAATGESVVEEVREPLVDVIEEEDHVLVLAEMPGVGPDDVTLEVRGDVLELSASRGDRKYRKEVLLPGACSRERMTVACNNGIVEIRCAK